MDQTPTAVGDLEAVETRDDTLRLPAETGSGQALEVKAAGSAHGPCPLANSPTLVIALPNAYLASLVHCAPAARPTEIAV